MKKAIVSVLLLGIIAAACISSCRPDSSSDIAPDTSGNISFAIPQGFPQPVYTFPNNPLSQKGFELGRKLFYEVRLSRDNTISCASCHQQFAAFAHLDHPLSHGIDGLFGRRNAPGLFNIAWKPAFFWDGGVTNIENQPQNPLENPVEMDLPLATAIARLNADVTYRGLFKAVFGLDTINSQQLFRALAQFMAAMVSANSKYDKYVRGEAGGTFTDQELRGLATFRAKCATCHKEPLFSDFSFRNNGLLPDAGLKDSGRAHITGLPQDMYKFLVPSLRNVDLTRPYMHDGRFTTLDAVVEHYRTGIVQFSTLDTLLTNGILMTDADKADIVAFLKTLSDTEYIKDARFSDPN